MSLTATDLGPLRDLAVALGVFTPAGDPNPGWFGNPEASLRTVLADEQQRNALIAFVDEAMGGADRTTDPRGVVWLPVVEIADPDLTVAVTIDEQADGIHVGIGLSVRTAAPRSTTSLSVPLFRARKSGGPPVTQPLLLGATGGRIRIATSITIDEAAPVPGAARLGTIGLDVDIPTAAEVKPPAFGLSLTGFQLPGASTPRDLRIAADGLDTLDDAVLDLVLSLVRAQANAAPDNSAIAALGGLLGLRTGDTIPDFPIAQLPAQGATAIASWLHGIITVAETRSLWIGHLADLLGVPHVGDTISFDLGGDAELTLALRTDTGPSGNARLTPVLGVVLGDAARRLEVRADLFQLDLVTGGAVAFPQLGVWAAAGRPGAGNRVLDATTARADTLRVGFALDSARRLVFVLAADGVVLGSREYPTLDLTSADAVMDVAGNTVGDVAAELLGSIGGALPAVRLLLGLDAPAGVTPVALTALMSNPVTAVGDYWRALVTAPAGAMTAVLAALRNALADATVATAAIRGTGTVLDPWRVPLIGPLALELFADGGTVLRVSIAASTSVHTLGEQCTVIDTRLAATLAEIDLVARRASLVSGVEGVLSARERGADPARVVLPLGGATLRAGGVGLRLRWTPDTGLVATVDAPDLQLITGGTTLPIQLPTIAADGTVALPAAAWDGLEALVGYLGALIGGVVGDLVEALGWTTEIPRAGGHSSIDARLRLADLVIDPEAALREWVPRLLSSDLGPEALALLADLFAGSGLDRGVLQGSGHPDDPYTLPLGAGIPSFAVWFPPEGLERRLVAAPESLRRWRPGNDGLTPATLAAALEAEARVAADVRALVDGRDVSGALAALEQRWVGGDGRIVPPSAAPSGVSIDRVGVGALQLVERLDLEDLTGRVPTTTVHVALGGDAWPDAPTAKRIDLTAPRLDASMFAIPAAATGDWFVALASRADAKVDGSTTDGTPEQAARLRRVLDALSSVSGDIVVVAVAGAGHAARVAAEGQSAVSDLVTLGTPLSSISLTAIGTQPTADALRLLHRLLPSPPVVDPEDEAFDEEDPDLALGRALVSSMMELVDRADPAADLRPPVVLPAAPRAGLTVTAVFGVVSESQVRRAVTAIVAAGLAERARARAATPLPPATGVAAGVRLVLPSTTSGELSVTGSALLTLFSQDASAGFDATRRLRVHLRVGDRLAWLAATPQLDLRMVTADVDIPLDGSGTGTGRITLHDARAFGQSWERLVLGTGDADLPVLPEARILLATAMQRIIADVAAPASLALSRILIALGIADVAGGIVGDAVDQLIHDPAGLIRQRLAVARAELSSAVAALLGPLATSVDLDSGTVRVLGGDDRRGRFGWRADLTASPDGVSGQLRIGASVPSTPAGGMQLLLDLQPTAPPYVRLQWHHPGGGIDSVTLWPAPDAAAMARMLARAAPALGAHVALELMRRADDTARPVIDAALDALGALGGAIGDVDRPIRPLAGLLADPAGWLRSSGSLGANPAKIQALFDALRPMLGVGGTPGSPLVLASGVTFTVASAGAGARLALAVDTGTWAAPAGVAARLAAGLATSVTVGASGPPVFALETHMGLGGGEVGRRAVHVRLGSGGIELFLRPATGADVPLIPFAGLGSLAAAAEAALPFLLDRVGEIPGTVGQLVVTVGDALALRSGTPRRFDPAALHAWGVAPVSALTAAVPSITSTGLGAIAPLLGAFVPSSVTVTATSSALTVTKSDVSLTWRPVDGVVSLDGADVAVSGVSTLNFTLALSAAGIEDLRVTAGPASIAAAGVTLRPFVTVAAGTNPPGGRRIAVGMAADATHRFAARWLLDTQQFALVASDGPIGTALDSVDPAQVALRMVEVVADLVAAVAMAQPPVAQLLDKSVGAITVRKLLGGVVLEDAAIPAALLDGLFDTTTLLERVQRLFRNLAHPGITITVDGLKLDFLAQGGVIGLQAGLGERFELPGSGDVTLWLENDDSWIDGNPPGTGGLFVGFLRDSSPFAFAPSLVVNGVGLRIGSRSGPILDAGITLDTIALHTFAGIDAGGAHSGGVQIQFSNLAVSASSAKGDNGIAQGIMRDTGPTPPKPAFSPALAIQKHRTNPVSVTLRAGEGAGPWWIAIQKGFGPLYLEQIGFGATMPGGRVQRVSLLMDGSVSMFGLTCAVDDLQITYLVAKGDVFNPNNWVVDLAGLAVSADMAGVTIAGGLLKQSTPAGIEYLGMLLGRFAVYGITIYGGYGEGEQNGQKFTAFFAVGAVNGPIGGPPAFFLTGIGGGFGINRRLVVPTDLSKFGDYPLIQALDIAATPQNPMDQLRDLARHFPMEKGTFWFAAGLSFNSFALVDGIAVVAVQIGDGLDISLLGLARMALPRPQVALVSIEIALVVRFSSSEGVLWVQGQLTDNSWLLYPDIKLTGGFAFVIWFKGEHRGEFVLTLGGYHPDFHRDGYPQVPRLGLRWSIGSNIVIKAGSYFALTSEALMAGGDFEASARFGPAWAEVKFGAHGIVYFDPFSYHVNVYARIAAGVTIDTWLFGEVTITLSRGARIDIEGPDFRGRATFEVGPIELTVAFGGSDKAQKQALGAGAFVDKYLEPATGSSARAHAVMTLFGALPAKGEQATPDGSSTRPFVVVVEFGLTFTSTVPATSVTRSLAPTAATTAHPPSRALGVAPMNVPNVTPTITLTWKRGGTAREFPFTAIGRPYGSFPVGVWGLPQDPNNRKVPKAEMIEALNELDLASRAVPSTPGPEVPYHQVEIGRRRPLPFTRRAAEVAAVKSQATAVSGLVTDPTTVAGAFATAAAYLASTATPTALASLRGERQSPPLVGALAERLDADAQTVIPEVGAPPVEKVYDHFIDAPIAVGFLTAASVDLRVKSAARTTVKGSARMWRTAPPTLASVEAERSRSIATRLVISDPIAVPNAKKGTVIGAVDVPITAVAHAAPAMVARVGAPGAERLADFAESMIAGMRTRRADGATLSPGETAVLKLPNAHADASLDGDRPRLGVSGAPARVVVLGHGGAVLADRVVGGTRESSDAAHGAIEIGRGTERILVMGQGSADQDAVESGLNGWHAGMQLPYAGWSTAIAPGCVVRSSGEPLPLHRERVDAGWVSGAELARGDSVVTTTFADAPTTIVIVLDDPAALGDAVSGRQLLLGLDGADRARGVGGTERPPVLLTMENRSVVAYDVIPDGSGPVIVTIASQPGWSLVGVVGSAQLTAAAAIAAISSRGLDAATHPFATTSPDARGVSRITWMGPTRTNIERTAARARAVGRPLPDAKPAKATKKPAKATKKRSRKAKKTTRTPGGRR